MINKKNILRIVQVASYYPPHLGGEENVTWETSKYLARKGHNVNVLTSSMGCSQGKLQSKGSLKIDYMRSFEVGHGSIIPALFFRLMAVSRDSIVHVTTGHIYVPEIVYVVCKIRKVPYVSHFHCDAGPSGKLGFLWPLYKRVILRLVLANSSKVICLTRGQKKLIQDKYGVKEDKIVVIPNGIGDDFFGGSRPSNQITNLLFVGRLAVEKNIPRLIDTVGSLRNRVTLHIVGDGERRAEIEEYISDKGLSNVILHGRKTGADLLKLYRSCDIFVLTSDREGIPLVLLEAMAAGLPIVASNIDGVREFVGNTGVLVSPLKANNFAAEIDKLIVNCKRREQLSAEGIEKVRAYSWGAIIEQIEAVYRDVAKGGSSK